MRVIFYTKHERGHWHRWRKQRESAAYHAIMFSNGRVWDTLNGWRGKRFSYKRSEVHYLRKNYAKV